MGKVIDGKDQRGAKDELLQNLDLVQVLDRDVENLSGMPLAANPSILFPVSPFVCLLIDDNPQQYLGTRRFFLNDNKI